MSNPNANLDRAACLDEQISFVLRTAATVHEEHGNAEAAVALRERARHHSLRATWQRALAAGQSITSENPGSLSDSQLGEHASTAVFDFQSMPQSQDETPAPRAGERPEVS